MSDVVLKTGISNNTYVWHSNDCACSYCQSLDGTEYEYIEDIPGKPHPNCKCFIEVVDFENNNDDDMKNDEKCDCLDDLLDEMTGIVGDAVTLQENIITKINEFSEILRTKTLKITSINIIESCIDALQQILGTVSDFARNYNDMKNANTKGADKYFHSKANCDGAKRGEIGVIVSKGISDLREFTDLFKNVLIKGMSVTDSLEDSRKDQEANAYGRSQGRNNPKTDSQVLVDIYRPNGLPDKY